MTALPSPFPRNEDLSQRITIIETKIPYVVDEINFLSNQIKELDSKVDTLNTNVALLVDQRDAARTSLGKWKNAGLSLSVALALGLIGFLARISYIVQSAHAATGYWGN